MRSYARKNSRTHAQAYVLRIYTNPLSDTWRCHGTKCENHLGFLRNDATELEEKIGKVKNSAEVIFCLKSPVMARLYEKSASAREMDGTGEMSIPRDTPEL